MNGIQEVRIVSPGELMLREVPLWVWPVVIVAAVVILWMRDKGHITRLRRWLGI